MRDGNGKTRSKYEPGGYDLRVKRSSAGLGLFAGEDIPNGKCVLEYVGRILTDEETYGSKSKYLFEVTNSIKMNVSNPSSIETNIPSREPSTSFNSR